ncbi:MAG: hypothetical protein ACD_21C00052G0012 [uncultured bacterium]|nr:MAG: hypothetical protein ACD_21C00052G0012 [uncultured bacterium]
MSKRIPAKLKTQLGEFLAKWYRHLGKVTPRRAYHEDDEGTGGGTANKMFEDHPFLAEMPIGAPSDLASVIVEDARTLDEANDRQEELTNELQNKLTLTLGKKLQKQHEHRYQPKPQPF